MIWIGGSGGLSRFADRTRGHGEPRERPAGQPGLGDRRRRRRRTCGSASIAAWCISAGRNSRSRRSGDHRLQYKLYDTSDGLAGAPLGSIRAARAADGRLWFVRGGGLTVVEPRALRDDRPLASAPLRIEAAVANERRFSADISDVRCRPAPTAADQLHGADAHRLQQDPLPLPPRRLRHRLDRRGHAPRRRSTRTCRRAIIGSGRGRHRRRPWNTATRDVGLRDPAGVLPDQLVLCVLGGDGRRSSCGAHVAGSRLRLVRRQFSLVLAERARLSREIHDTLLQSLVGVALQFDAISDTLGLVVVRRAASARADPPSCRGLHPRSAPVDLGSAFAGAGDARSARRAARVRQAAAAGKPVRFAASGTGPPRQCSAKVENQLLRIGQEAITNAVRHARCEAHSPRTEVRRNARSRCACPTTAAASTASPAADA